MITAAGFGLWTLGRRCTVLGATPDEEAWLRRYWEFATPTARRHPMSLTVRFAHMARREAHLPGRCTISTFSNATVVWRQLGHRRWIAGGNAGGVQLRIDTDEVWIDVWRVDGEETNALVENALFLALCEALRSTGLTPLHASIIARDGEAIALTGPSGAGKSTCLLRALDYGWQPIAEDFAWLDVEAGNVYGWDRGIRLTPEGVGNVPVHWRSRPWQAAEDGKLFLSYESFAPAKPSAARLTRLALVQNEPGDESAWAPLKLRDRVRVLCEAAGVPICPVNRQDFASRVPSLLARIDVSRLIVGSSALPL